MSFFRGMGGGALWLALTLAGGVAQADVVAVVSAKSTVPSVSKSQIVDLFLGKTRFFPDGTVALPIDQAEGSPARTKFYQDFASKSPAQIKAHWSKVIFTGRGEPPPTVSNSMEVKKRIAANSAAIGYIERSLLDASVRELP